MCTFTSLLIVTCTFYSLDGVASQAFNGLTAMYYLLEQKHHAKRLKKAESSKTQIRQNSSNLSKPETGSDTNESTRPQAAAPVSAQAPQHAPPQCAPPQHAPPPYAQQHHQQAHKAPAPLKLMSIEPLAPISTLVERAPKEEKNVPIKTFVPVTPYLQTPFILQQQQQQNQRQQQHSNMPSLDAYLRGGMELPMGAAAPKAELSLAHPSEQSTKPNVGSVVVPPLNLRSNKPNTGNSTSAAVAVATGSLLGNKPVLTSQTARGPAPSALHPLAHAPAENSAAAHPQSARVAAPGDMPADIPERPNTRRSHLRSRGGEPHAELAPAEVVAPGVGLDSMPPTRETAPQMAVRRPEGSVPSSGAKAGVSASVDDTPAAAMSLLVISQKKNISEHAQSQGSTPSPTAQVSVTPVAPEAPKSSSASSSGGFAGRRGKNITSAAGSGSAPSQPAVGNAPASGGTTVSANAQAPTVTVVPLVSPMGVQPAPPAGGRPRPQPQQHSSVSAQPVLAPIQTSIKPTAPQ